MEQDERQLNLVEVARHMDVSSTEGNRIYGRIHEPVPESIVELKKAFAGYGLIAYFSRHKDGHEIVYGEAPRLKQPRRWVNLVLFLATVLTTLLVGAFQMGKNPFVNPLDLYHGIPFSLSILLILGSHELGHYFTARRLGVDATLPYFLPVPHPMTGTMGAFIKMRSPVPSKAALIRVGVAGPLVGFIVAIPVTIIGLAMSTTVALDGTTPGIQLGSSLIFWLLSHLRFGSLPQGVDVMLNPVAFAGWLGFFVTGLNLLPAGQLDGGHIVYAVLGAPQVVQLGGARLSDTYGLLLARLAFLGYPDIDIRAAPSPAIGRHHSTRPLGQSPGRYWPCAPDSDFHAGAIRRGQALAASPEPA